MGAMSELHIGIEEMLHEGWTPSAIASKMQIPIEWVISIEDGFYCVPHPDDYADADAVAYGTR